MSIESVLSRVGLSDRAVKVYMTCLQMGTATMTELAKVAGLKRSTTYLVVDELLVKGFLSVRTIKAKKYYSPEPPKKIKDLMEFRLKEVENVMPELEALYSEPTGKPRVQLYEGVEALKKSYDPVLEWMKDGGEALFFASVSDVSEEMPDLYDMFINFMKRNPNVRMRELNQREEAGIKHLEWTKQHMGKNHGIRFLDKNAPIYNDNVIFNDKLMVISYRKNLFSLVIEHKEIADTYRSLFNAAWNSAKEIS